MRHTQAHDDIEARMTFDARLTRPTGAVICERRVTWENDIADVFVTDTIQEVVTGMMGSTVAELRIDLYGDERTCMPVKHWAINLPTD